MLNELANAKTTASGEGNHMIQLAIKRDEFISSSQGKTDLKFPIIFEILQSKNRQKKNSSSAAQLGISRQRKLK